MSKVYQAEEGTRFWLGCCSKCDGDLYENRDHYGAYIACIQCGRYLTGAETARLRLGCKTSLRRAAILPPKICHLYDTQAVG